MKNYTMGDKTFYFLTLCSSCIVFANYYSEIPTEVDWRGAKIYIMIIFAVSYFTFMVIVMVSKLEETFFDKEQKKNATDKMVLMKEF